MRNVLPVCLLMGAALLFAQDWKTATTLPAVDMEGLNQAKKASALRMLRNHDCSCGCNMKVAECRMEDPKCAYSRGLAQTIVDALKAGKTESDALASANESRWAHLPTRKLLDDPVTIPVAGSPVLGPQNARITLVEFSDFQCPYCVKAVGELHTVMKAYPNDVKLIFKQFPLDSHSQAFMAATAALAAQKQGKFWEMHDALFANRNHLTRTMIVGLALGLALDTKRFATDMDSPAIKAAVEKDVDDGERAGVEGTPTIYIDGQRYNGSLALEAIKPVLDAELKKPPKK